MAFLVPGHQYLPAFIGFSIYRIVPIDISMDAEETRGEERNLTKMRSDAPRTSEKGREKATSLLWFAVSGIN